MSITIERLVNDLALPNIKINRFDGPFDLLLHLLKQNKMDIYDIKIYDITKQYLDYINTMKEFDMEVASEFIVVAATLLEIKSRSMLPKPKVENNGEDDDPRKDLVEKLLEYKLYKEAALYFEEKSLYNGTTFTKQPEVVEVLKDNKDLDIIKDKSIIDLYKLYTELMERYKQKINTTTVAEKKIMSDEYTVEDKCEFIVRRISRKKKFYFKELAEECECKMEIIVTFLALLELIKLKDVIIVQNENFDKIYIERVEQDG